MAERTRVSGRTPLLLLALSAGAAAGARRAPHEIRAAYERSAAACRHGHADGVIVTLHDDAHPHEYMAKLRGRARSGDTFMQHFTKVGRYVAARLSTTSLAAVFEDEHALSVHADCIVRRHVPSEARILPAARAEASAATVLAQSAGGVSEHNVTAGVMSRSASSPERWNWGPDRIDSSLYLDNMYRYGRATGKGTRLYHLDTGIYLNHDDFGGRAHAGFSAGCPTGKEAECGKKWFHRGEITQADVSAGNICDGHGTHTASTAVGTNFGVAKEATVVSVQSLDCTGSATNAQVLMAFEWAVNDALESKQPSVITLSLGGEYSEFLNKGTTRVAEYGIPVVVASGNDGENACQTSPASTPSAITVGGVDMNDAYASYSNWGQCVDIFAPGSDITAAYTVQGHRNSAALLSGTSMATPHVAGAVLQLLQLHPKMRPDDVKRALLCMATTNAIKGLDAYTPNRLLHTGEALSVQGNKHLLDMQVRPSPVAIRTASEAHPANFSGFEKRYIGNAGHLTHVTSVTPDATTCLVGEGTARWSGYSEGSTPPADKRVTASSTVFTPFGAAATSTADVVAQTQQQAQQHEAQPQPPARAEAAGERGGGFSLQPQKE